MNKSSKKRIAIQLFGHLRSFEISATSLKKEIIDLNPDFEFDIFIHTWDEIDHNTINWRNSTSTPPKKRLSEHQKLLIEKLYKPKKLLIDKQLECEDFTYDVAGGFKCSFKGLLNNAYTTKKANDLRVEYCKETGITHDLVICTRPDIFFLNSLNIKRLISEAELLDGKDYLFYGFNPDSLIFTPIHTKATDIFFIGKPDVITKATSLFDKIYEKFDKDTFINNEFWWHSHWKSEGIIPIPLNFCWNIDWVILYNTSEDEINKRLRGVKKYWVKESWYPSESIKLVKKEKSVHSTKYLLFGTFNVFTKKKK